MSQRGDKQREAKKGTTPHRTVVVEINAAYNAEGLPLPPPNGPNGKRILNLEMLLTHAFYWDWLNERETEEVLMDIYVTRTRRMH